jgi:hypothetical protein
MIPQHPGDRALRAARAQAGTVPAAAQEQGRKPGRLRAAAGGDVEHAEAHGRDVVTEQVVVVPAGIRPLLLRRVARPAVKLHAQPEIGVVVIEEADAARQLTARLAAGGRQAVGTFDVAHVAPLKR